VFPGAEIDRRGWLPHPLAQPQLAGAMTRSCLQIGVCPPSRPLRPPRRARGHELRRLRAPQPRGPPPSPASQHGRRGCGLALGRSHVSRVSVAGCQCWPRRSVRPKLRRTVLATRPAIAPARRIAFLFNAGCAVLTGRPQSSCDADASSIDAGRICLPEESKRGAPEGSTFAVQAGI